MHDHWSRANSILISDTTTGYAMTNFKDFLKYDLMRNALLGAVIGAGIAHFVPLLRVTNGAFLGALILVAIGVYKNLSNKSPAITKNDELPENTKDVLDEMLKLDNLRKSGAITEAEFQALKNKLLTVRE